MRDSSLNNPEYKLLQIKNWTIYHTFSKPRTLVIELSTVCNRSCTYCFRKGIKKFEEKYLEESIIRKILETENKYDKIVLTGYGEPSLHPEFDSIVLKLSDISHRLLINTNGSLLQDHISVLSKLMRKVEIFLSVHDISYTISLVEDLVSKLGRSIITCIRCIVTVSQENLDKCIVAIEELIKLGIPKIYVSCIVPVNYNMCQCSCIDSTICENTIKQLALRSVFGSFIRNSFVYVPRFRSSTGFFICPFVENDSVFVRADASVCPCMFYAYELRTYIHCIERVNIPLVFGNLYEKTIEEVWNLPEYSRFRFLATTRQFPNCLECELEQYCSFTMNNLQDCWGNSPTCSYCPFARGLVYCPT